MMHTFLPTSPLMWVTTPGTQILRLSRFWRDIFSPTQCIASIAVRRICFIFWICVLTLLRTSGWTDDDEHPWINSGRSGTHGTPTDPAICWPPYLKLRARGHGLRLGIDQSQWLDVRWAQQALWICATFGQSSQPDDKRRKMVVYLDPQCGSKPLNGGKLRDGTNRTSHCVPWHSGAHIMQIYSFIE